MENTKLTQLYEDRCKTISDINKLLPKLSWYASRCNRIAEFGVRDGNSTITFLHGMGNEGRKALYSYDLEPATSEVAIRDAISYPSDPWPKVTWTFLIADTRKASIPHVDMLFVDAWHSYDAVYAELSPATRAGVHKYLAFHDTELFGWRDQRTDARRPGILPAILQRLANDGRWALDHYTQMNNGLTVFRRV